MTTTIDPANYQNEENARISKYYKTNKKKLGGFTDQAGFSDWYFSALHTNSMKCHYCNTSILDIRQLLNRGVIAGRLVRGGASRGPNFEIDRMDPNGSYSRENCVLSCYYCNNDKSNTYNYTLYKNYIGPIRQQMWESLKRIV